MAPGPVPMFSSPARVYNYGGTAFNKDLKALIECSYMDGVNVFPAGSFITVTWPGAGTCTNVSLGVMIDRAP